MDRDSLIEDAVVEGPGGPVVATLVRRDGPVQGRILFVNGALTTATALKWAVRALTDFELVLFDFPGIGRSRALNPGACAAGPEQDAAVVLRLMERYRPDLLVSLSWGGTSALLALAERPLGPRRAIIGSYSCGMSPVMRRFCEDLLAHLAGGDRDAAADLAARGLGEGLNGRLQSHYRDYFLSLDAEQEAAIVAHIQQVATLDTERYRERLARIRLPVLFANGAADRFTPPESARGFAAVIPHAQFQTLPDCGHFLAGEGRAATAQVCDGIRRWWAPEARMAAAE